MLKQYETICDFSPYGNEIYWQDPPELASLCDKYDKYFEGLKAKKLNLSNDYAVTVDEFASDSSKMLGNLDSAFDKQNDSRITIKKFNKNFFVDFPGFKNGRVDEPILPEDIKKTPMGCDFDYTYSVDTSLLAEHMHYTKFITINISGGIVVPNKYSAFHEHLAPDCEGDWIKAGIVDFNSLYPTNMEYGNICQTAASYNPHYAIRVPPINGAEHGMFVNPFNEKFITCIGSPVKINKSFIQCSTFIISPEIYISECSKLIAEMKALRVKMKNIQKQCVKNGDHVGASRADGLYIFFLIFFYFLLYF